ncbi:hypothetical protein DSO57_1010996 [Entomophthora muscae]|uniref:Uncharacterized protein n=1 Tax=Entomophthora muscae TaxID=34485 RepID=A0ACC2RL77_9FUNG|nr:hypothetical protein DSO57_1010996 [Entomophthora muscae]
MKSDLRFRRRRDLPFSGSISTFDQGGGKINSAPIRPSPFIHQPADLPNRAQRLPNSSDVDPLTIPT